MKLQSINVSQAKEQEFDGRMIESGIWKEALTGPVRVNETNLEGDRQVNLEVHGGIHKAAYAFSADQYPFWQKELCREDLPPGMFGENLTISGLDERDVRIGDQWQIGSVSFAVTGPRLPCTKLGAKFNDKSVPTRFTKAGFPGVYLRVLLTGTITAGDAVHVVKDESGETIYDLYFSFNHPHETGSQSVMSRALLHPYLDPAMAAAVGKRIKA